MKKLLIALVALLVLALACGPSDTSQLGDPAEAKWLSKVMAIEYRQDPVRFELERVGSQIRTHGRIYSIQTSRSVAFSRWPFGRTLVCQFADPKELANLRKGDDITVTGVIDYIEDPYVMGKLHMVDCKLTNE